MKKLKKILLINWLYFSKELIELEDINFLTGENKAGKSTIIDALQIVLLGELNSNNFNKAANENSERTLDGYLRADRDKENQNCRLGKDFSSYIACEFWDDKEEKKFVIGIVFDCYSSGSYRDQFFIYDGVIPDNCFIINQQAMDITELRSYLKKLYNSKAVLYDSNKKYRNDLIAKWNVHNEQIYYLLKKSVAFQPISDIQKFITENICDIPDRPDINAMQQNIRDYKKQESIAKYHEEKIIALKEINKLYRKLQLTINELQKQQFVIAYAEKENITIEYTKAELEKQDCQDNIKKVIAEIEQFDSQLKLKNHQRDELIAKRANSDVYKEKERLSEHQNHLNQEYTILSSQLSKTQLEIKREAQILCKLCEKIEKWPEDKIFIPLKKEAESLRFCYTSLCNFTLKEFGYSLTQFETVQNVTSKFSTCLQQTSYQLDSHVSKLKKEDELNETKLKNLKCNIKDYPKELLSLKKWIEEQLEHSIFVEILADVLEIADGEEIWRGAVEGYLNTQKFYLLVEPQVYTKALLIYDSIKKEYRNQSFGLVDIGKLREREKLKVLDNSLAQKVITQNDLARSYIDYLLGNVICCTHVRQLRKYHTSITADGMLYQGYVTRSIPHERMEAIFIGHKSVTIAIEQSKIKQDNLNSELNKWSPLKELLDIQKNREFIFTNRFISNELSQRHEDYLKSLQIQNEIAITEDKLSHLNLLWLDKIKSQIEELEQEISQLTSKISQKAEAKGNFESILKMLENNTLPDIKNKLKEKENTILTNFTEYFQKSEGIPYYKQELLHFKKAAQIAKSFSENLYKVEKEYQEAKQLLFKARNDYREKFKPCFFQIDAMVNDEFDTELKELEENKLPEYKQDIQKAYDSALEQFQNHFLAKLKSNINQVEKQVKILNRSIESLKFGTDKYEFLVERNPDYKDYYGMITAPELMEGEGGVFAIPFQKKFGPLIEEFFNLISNLDNSQLNKRTQSEIQKNIERYTDFRTYLKFDLATTDQNGNRELLSKTLNKSSGGETQTPFYIAIIASFAQMYQVNNPSNIANNTVRLVIFDEAFNKMDGNHIIQSIKLLRELHLQAIICAPPDKSPDIMPEADKTLLVQNINSHMQVINSEKEFLYK